MSMIDAATEKVVFFDASILLLGVVEDIRGVVEMQTVGNDTALTKYFHVCSRLDKIVKEHGVRSDCTAIIRAIQLQADKISKESIRVFMNRQ
ncbi:hypothetical protein TIFTF001_053335 [Ficus carica]|uniref:Uncharacterized protein n=1 Tax=Ficus carica TaxID=3494 RepID=A0AA88EA81_FICCA|nr:hypothetical protein TIFTF001_053335 [Ficus carica]